jgi:hypothetical protein
MSIPTRDVELTSASSAYRFLDEEGKIMTQVEDDVVKFKVRASPTSLHIYAPILKKRRLKQSFSASPSPA